ncbi:MAG: ClpXP protease specificity-enhancing factor [Nitrospirota bacterium]|nr:ClpXP protease specificity-enhancing factor [Nitrospirota bacterium]
MLPLSARPYMVRALYEWCVHEGHTPYLLVATEVAGVRVPEGYGKDGKITLNVGPRAVQNLDLGQDRVRFSARFGGRHQEVEVPIKALVAIFAAESHEGLVFGEPDLSPAQPPENQADGATDTPENAPEAVPEREAGREAESAAKPGSDDEPPKGGPRLRLVK